MCNKIIYNTDKQAREVLNLLHRRGIRCQRKIIAKRTYYCKKCKGFHLTSLKNDLLIKRIYDDTDI